MATASENASPEGASSPYRLLKALLACGVVSSLVYLASDIAASTTYPGYSYVNQAYSELLAIGSPTRPFLIAAGNIYNPLVVLFGVGVVLIAGSRRWLKAAGIALCAYGIISGIGPYVPMHPRGVAFTLTDALHIADTIGMILAMLLFMAFGAVALRGAFRVYSIATIAAIFAGATGALMQTNAMKAGLATPLVGVVERVNIYAMLLWVGVFSVVLLRGAASRRSAEAPADASEPLDARAVGPR